MSETWLPIPGFDGYEVSSGGARVADAHRAEPLLVVDLDQPAVGMLLDDQQLGDHALDAIL